MQPSYMLEACIYTLSYSTYAHRNLIKCIEITFRVKFIDALYELYSN